MKVDQAMRIRRLLTALLIAIPCTAAPAQTIPYDVEIGYRWLDTSGNRDMYKSQINEQSGFLLRALTLSMADPDGTGTLLDHLRIDASDLGTGPSGSLRLTAGRNDIYRLRLDYRDADLYSALPAFANPLLGQGIIPGQQTYDRNRDRLNLDLELLPGRRIVPLIGYSWNRLEGPGTTTFTLGGDEFRLGSDLEATDEEIRIGAAFNFGMVQGVVTQGWRDYDSRENLTLITGAGSGNSPNPILGRPITSDTIQRESRTDAEAPFTQVFVSAQPLERLRLIGNYDRSSADADDIENDTASGSFVSFPLGRFFDGRVEDVSGNASNDSWRGGLRAEYALSNQYMITASATRHHRELEGSSLITTIFIDSITFGGADPRDLERILAAQNAMEREDDRISIGAAGRAIGPFSFRAEYSETNQDVVVTPDLSEIVVPGGQGGSFSRDISSIDLGAGWARSGFTIGAEYRRDDADDVILRTDYRDRDRIRLRAGWRTPGNLLRVGLTGEETNQDNDQPGIDFDAEVRQFTGDLEVSPIETVRIRASFSRFDADSRILFRRPENFVIQTSEYSQDGDVIEGGLLLLFSEWFFDVSASRIENEGSSPYEIDRLRVRGGYDFTERVGVLAEWLSDSYDEPLLPLADYEADRFGLYLRLRP